MTRSGSSTRTDAPSLVERNRAIHRMLVDGVTVEYRAAGRLDRRGARLASSTSTTPANNDWLAVNQFTVVEGQHDAPAGRRRCSSTACRSPSSS